MGVGRRAGGESGQDFGGQVPGPFLQRLWRCRGQDVTGCGGRWDRGLIPHLMSGDPSFPRASPHDGGRRHAPVGSGWVGGEGVQAGGSGGGGGSTTTERRSMTMSRARGGGGFERRN